MSDRKTSRTNDGRDETPGPAEERDTGTTGSTDERSSENREKGLEKDRGRARKPDEVTREDES